jgi:hypothetical protein
MRTPRKTKKTAVRAPRSRAPKEDDVISDARALSAWYAEGLFYLQRLIKRLEQAREAADREAGGEMRASWPAIRKRLWPAYPRGYLYNLDRPLLEAGRAYLRAEREAGRGPAGRLANFLTARSWELVLGKASPQNVIDSARQSRGDGGPEATADDVRRAARKVRKDTSSLVRVHRVYAKLAWDADVYPRPDTRAAPRGELRNLLFGIGYSMKDPECVAWADAESLAASLESKRSFIGAMQELAMKDPEKKERYERIAQGVQTEIDELLADTDKESDL